MEVFKEYSGLDLFVVKSGCKGTNPRKRTEEGSQKKMIEIYDDCSLDYDM